MRLLSLLLLLSLAGSGAGAVDPREVGADLDLPVAATAMVTTTDCDNRFGRCADLSG